MQWTIKVERVGTGFRWSLYDRHGDYVAGSRITYPSRDDARGAARYEQSMLADVQVID